MFNEILLPLDGSPLAEHALQTATAIAEKFNSVIFLLRVYEPHYPITSVSGAAMDEIIEKLRAAAYAEADEYLTTISEKLTEQGFNVKTRIFEGSPVAKHILDIAKADGIDLIVMSTHGRGGLDRWVFGSVADRVLRHANVPVLLIRASD